MFELKTHENNTKTYTYKDTPSQISQCKHFLQWITQRTYQKIEKPLTGNYAGTRKCHLKPDVLLIYWIDDLFVQLYRTGSHSELL